ncbi:MAG TPA: glycosyltransferase [Solirubrobacteraceae bacterium]|nr:glycosyltransferase [Solirubrobacteraceae bacterium]
MDSSTLPKVSALMGAYNYGRYIGEAIESAMAQDYPPELLELVIVDDGSTDDTAEIVQRHVERHPGRIRFVQQANAGATAATNRARAEATGELIALLDADDVWLPDKTRRQVELMQRRPELGLVFSRMRIIDGEGRTVANNYGHQEPMPGNHFARVLWENVAVQSSLIIEAQLFDRIPDQAPYADWWLALRAAEFKQVEYLREELVLYRWHGENITGGVSGPKALREAQKGIQFQRWVLRNFELRELMARLSPEEMQYVWSGLENQATKGLQGIGSYFGELATVDDQDRSDARADAEAAHQAQLAGDLHTECGLLLRARACDPYDQDLRERFLDAVRRASEAAALPDPLTGNRGFAIVADAAFLLSDDSHLRAYAEVMRPITWATLVIDASAMDPAAASTELPALVARCGLGEDDDISMIGLVGALAPSQRFRVRKQTNALYSPESAAANGTPAFTPQSLPQLRELAEQWQQRRAAGT